MKFKLVLILAVLMIATSCSKENEPISTVYTPKNSREVALKNMANDVVLIQEFTNKNRSLLMKYLPELKTMNVQDCISFLRSKGAVDLNSYKEVLLRTADDQKEFNYYTALEKNQAIKEKNSKEFTAQIVKLQNQNKVSVAEPEPVIDWCRIKYAIEIAAIIAADVASAGTTTPAAIILIIAAAADYTICVIQRDKIAE